MKHKIKVKEEYFLSTLQRLRIRDNKTLLFFMSISPHGTFALFSFTFFSFV